MELSISVKGVQQFNVFSSNYPKVIERTILQTAGFALQTLRKATPVKAGGPQTARKGWFKEDRPAGKESRSLVINRVPHMKYLDEGTVPHKIFPKNKSALHFFWHGKGGGRETFIPKNMGYWDTRNFWINLAKSKKAILGFKGYVNHPGTKALFIVRKSIPLINAYMSKAFTQKLNNLLSSLQRLKSMEAEQRTVNPKSMGESI